MIILKEKKPIKEVSIEKELMLSKFTSSLENIQKNNLTLFKRLNMVKFQEGTFTVEDSYFLVSVTKGHGVTLYKKGSSSAFSFSFAAIQKIKLYPGFVQIQTKSLNLELIFKSPECIGYFS